MGVFQLTLNGVDRSSAIDQESIEISEQLRARGSTCRFRYRVVNGSPAKPEGGNEVIITNGATREFAGHLVIPTFTMWRDEAGNVVFDFTCECTDYAWILDRYLVYDRDSGSSAVYPSQAAGTTAIALINTYTDGSFDTSGIATGLTAQGQEFDAIPVSEALDRLARETGYIWNLSYTKVVNFFVLEQNIAPIDRIDLDNESRIYDMQGEDGDVSQVHNSIYLRDVQLTDTTTINEYFTGNGVSRFFPLSYPPSPRTADVTISAAGVGWVTRFDDQSGYTPSDERSGTGTAFLCVFNRGLRLESALTAGTIFTASYKRTTPRMAWKQDGASISEMSRREGLTGRAGAHEHVISLPQLQGATTDALEARLDLALLQNAWPRQRLAFRTKVEGWRAGQYAQIISAALNLNRRMYVQSVTKRVVDGTSGTWEWSITWIDQLHGDV